MEKNKIEDLQRFLAEEPGDSFIKYALALEYLKLEDYKEALSYFVQILASDENYLAAYYHYGKLLEKTGEGVRAEPIYLKGIEVAQRQGNKHTLAELQAAYNLLKDIEDEDID